MQYIYFQIQLNARNYWHSVSSWPGFFLRQMSMSAPTVERLIKSFQTGATLGKISIPSTLLTFRPDIIKQCIQYEMSWLSQSTASTKQLGQVRGSSQKPFPQKGRGKARVGTIRAPQHKGGYTVHGPRPHTKMLDINRKVYDLGIKSCLGVKFTQEQVHIMDDLVLNTPSKQGLLDVLEKHGLKGKKLYFITLNQGQLIRITDQFTKKLMVGGLGGEKPILMTNPQHVGCKNMMDYDELVIDKRGLEFLIEKYMKYL